MNSTPLLFLGILLGLSASWWGLVAAPRLQLGSTSTVIVQELNQHYPANRPGMAEQGAEVYRREGCYTCHSQMVRPAGYGFDLSMGWGTRRTVGRDYLRDTPVMLGSVRVGPDLSNIAQRMGSGDTNLQPTMVAYHLKHLYNPRSVGQKGAAGKSVMPAYPYLFEKRRIRDAAGSTEALKLDGPFAPEAGFEIVPKPEAKMLVSYLLSLRSTVSLPEAPIIPPPTNKVASGTNSAQGGSAR